MPFLRAIVFLAVCLVGASLAMSSPLHAASHWKYHRVQKGENLTAIARKFKVSVSEIVAWNSLKNANHIFAGQKLKIKNASQKQLSTTREKREVKSPKFSAKDAKALRLKKPVSKWKVEVGYRPKGDVRHYGLLCRIPEKTSIFPAHEGRVAKVGHMRGYGKYILIDHGSGWHSMYLNLRKIYVKPGQYVSLVDSIGAANNNKLFFLLAYQGKPVNPAGYFR